MARRIFSRGVIIPAATLLLTGCLMSVLGSTSAGAATGGYPYWNMPCVVSPYGATGHGYWCTGYNWGTTSGNTSNASELSPYGYDYRNCTDFVAWKLSTLGVKSTQYRGLGNANTWALYAPSHGLRVSSAPSVGSVAVSTAGTFGHVAFVTAVSGGNITVSQYNQGEDGNYSLQTGTPAQLGFSSFVHFEAYETTGGAPVVAAPTPIPTKTSAANHVLRVSATGTAYLVDSAGVPHWIPDALTYDCDVAKYPLWNGLTQQQVNTLGNGQPWATRCARLQDAANHILIVSATNTSYLAGSNGVPHWIPSAAVYNCLVRNGYPVFRHLVQPQVDSLGNGKPWATCGSASVAVTTAALTYSETTGGVSHTWTNYVNAGGTEGPSIASNETVQITCRTTGFTVADGDTWWYKIASNPWNNAYWISADAFFNDGATSGSLAGTPFFDPAVPVCNASFGSGSSSGAGSGSGATSPLPATTYSETVGGVAHTWTNYANAGGTEGPSIASNQTVQITCRTTGFMVADGDTWWYQIASSPWNNNYWVSADAFYNNGATSGSLSGTPFVDPNVRVC